MDQEHNKNVTHITQSWQWGEFRKLTGVRIIRENNFTLYLHKIPHTNLNVGYLPRPPKLDESLINEAHALGKINHCIFIKIEPELSFNIKHLTCLPAGMALNKINPSKSILPRHTFFIDLTKSEEELLKAMEPKTRYNIKVAQKHDVVIKSGTEKDLDEFIKILEDTELRQGFLSHPGNYYRTLWQILKPVGMVYLLLACPPNDSKPIASIMLFKFNDVLYYPYGGSLAASRHLMPNYLLHWEAIKLGKKLGAKIYDMWGAYLEKPAETDPWFGIYRFKQGFGGKLITYPQSIDLVINPFLYKLYQITDTLRWQFIHFKRHLRV